MVTTLQTIVLVATILAGLALLGYPIKRVLEYRRSPLCVPTMVIGIAIVQVVAWHWLDFGGHGLSWPMNALLAVSGLFALVDVARRRRKIMQMSQPAVRRAIASLSIGFVVVAINWSTVLSLPLLTTANAYNNDAVSYAISSEHLARGGFDDAGPAVGTDLGANARVDAFGSLALIGSVSAVSRLGAWRVATSTLFALVILTTYGLAILVDTLMGGDRWLLASAIAGAASCTLLFVYVQTVFFAGQIMAMAVVPLLAVAAIRMSDATRRAELLGPLVSATAVCLVMLSHYAHMLILGAPLFVLPAVLDRRSGERFDAAVRRSLRTIAVSLASVVLAFVIVPAWFTHTIDLIRHNADVNVGWPFPGFSLTEILGFTRSIRTRPSSMRIERSVIAVLVVVLSCLIVRSSYRRLVRYFAVFSSLVLVSYFVVFQHEGASYRQWKWITFFQPTLVVLVVGVVGLALENELRTRVAGKKGIAFAAAGSFAFLVSSDTRVSTSLREARQIAYASAAHYELSTDPVLKGLTEINVDVSPYWDTMWAVYFLPKKTLYLESESYYPRSVPRAAWTLVPGGGTIRGPAVHEINAQFRLLHEDPAGPSSVEPSALEGTIAVSLDQKSVTSGQIAGTVSAVNLGPARWLPQSAPGGGVAVGVHLEDENGDTVDYDWARIQLIAGREFDLPPDTTTDEAFTLPMLPAGRYRLEFELVSEQVTWFGASVTEDVSVP